MFNMVRTFYLKVVWDICNRVCTGPGKSGKSWNFVVAFSRTGKCWKKATGPGKFWKSVNSSK